MAPQPRASTWCFTINNYTPETELHISTIAPSSTISYIIYGREVASTGTKHLQGTVCFKSRVRPKTIKNLFRCGHMHLEITKDVHASIEYCQKEGDFVELGTFEGKSQGKRNDLEDFKTDVKAGKLSLKEIRESHSKIYAKYPRFCIEYVADNRPSQPFDDHDLFPWQRDLLSKLEGEPDPRQILFVVDEEGNKGKSWFAFHVERIRPNTQVLQPGKKADMAYILEEDTTCMIMDAPRSKQGEYLQYDFLEEVKNGRVFCPKYESRMKRLAKCHVVVMMNEHPDLTKLSDDRYSILTI